jgi:hypothetical protein
MSLSPLARQLTADRIERGPQYVTAAREAARRVLPSQMVAAGTSSASFDAFEQHRVAGGFGGYIGR